MMKKRPLTALEFSREDARQKGRTDRWSYFRNLRGKVQQELEETGRCSLLDQALESQSLYPFDIFALTDLANARLENRAPMDQEQFQKFLWECRSPFNRWIGFPASGVFDQHTWANTWPVTQELRGCWTKLREQYAPGRQPAPAPPAQPGPEAPSGELEELRAAALQAQQALRTQEEELRRCKQELADSRLAEEQVRRQLHDLEDLLRSRQEEALAPARAQAEEILAAARRQGEEQARQLLEQAQQAASRLRQEVQGLWQQEYAKGSAERQAYAESLLQVRQGLDQEAGRFQGQVVESLNAAVEGLNRVKQELCTHLRSWQEDLYRAQHQQLAVCYVNLTRILAGAEGLAASQDPAVQRLVRNLGLFRITLEKAMLRLGLEAFYAQAGEAFDPARHVEAGGEYTETDADPLVRRCVWPGVLQHLSRDEDSRVLVRAEVELEG